MEKDGPIPFAVYGAAVCAYVFVGFDRTTWEFDRRIEVEAVSRTPVESKYGLSSEERTEFLISAVQLSEEKTIRLLSSEQLGWWQEKKAATCLIRDRTVVSGATNDVNAKNMSDSGANVSLLSVAMARGIKLTKVWKTDRALGIQGISNEKAKATHKCSIKVTLGWQVAYCFEV